MDFGDVHEKVPQQLGAVIFDHDNDGALVDGEVAVGHPVFFGAEGIAESVWSPDWVFLWLGVNIAIATATAVVCGVGSVGVVGGKQGSHRTYIEKIAQGGETLFGQIGHGRQCGGGRNHP